MSLCTYLGPNKILAVAFRLKKMPQNTKKLSWLVDVSRYSMNFHDIPSDSGIFQMIQVAKVTKLAKTFDVLNLTKKGCPIVQSHRR